MCTLKEIQTCFSSQLDKRAYAVFSLHLLKMQSGVSALVNFLQQMENSRRLQISCAQSHFLGDTSQFLVVLLSKLCLLKKIEREKGIRFETLSLLETRNQCLTNTEKQEQNWILITILNSNFKSIFDNTINKQISVTFLTFSPVFISPHRWYAYIVYF